MGLKKSTWLLEGRPLQYELEPLGHLKAEVDTLEAEVKKLKEDRLAEEETLKAF